MATLPHIITDTRLVATGRGLLTGWSVDPSTGKPASTVVATNASGKVVATAITGFTRSDVADVLHDPAALQSGFSLVVPQSTSGPLTLYGLGSNRRAYSLGKETGISSRQVQTKSPITSITDNGVSYLTVPGTLAGGVEGVTSQRSQVYEVNIPGSVTLATTPGSTSPPRRRWITAPSC